MALTAAAIFDPSAAPDLPDAHNPAWPRARSGEEELAAPSGADSSGYREAVRAYFNALGKTSASR